jgi:DNA repair protein RadC
MPLKVKELPISERPYEKLEMYGAESLSNAELLAIIIKTGIKNETSINVAQNVLNLNKNSGKQDLRFLHEISINDFMNIKGIGKVKAIQLKAVGELTKRISKPINNNKIIIKNSEDVANLLIPEMKYEKREIAKVIILNSKNVILRIVDISIGGSNFACIEPKDVLSEALKMQAPKIILVHNHPSGNVSPSKGDYLVTDRVYECADIMGIELLDHIIIGDGTYESILNKKGNTK